MVYNLLHCEPKDFKGKNRWKQKARTFLFFGATHYDMAFRDFDGLVPPQHGGRWKSLLIRPAADIHLSKSNAAGSEYPT
jgi:hypothetical protein